MTILLWSLQGILCAILLTFGSAKIFLPKDKLLQRMPVYTNVPLILVRLLGFSELLAAGGIVLPALLNIAPFITSVTAITMAVILTGALITHIIRNEYKQAVLPSVLLLAAIAVAVLML